MSGLQAELLGVVLAAGSLDMETIIQQQAKQGWFFLLQPLGFIVFTIAAFAEAVKTYPEVLDCYVLLGNVDFLLRIVTEDIKSYEQFFFERLSQLPGIQEVNSSISLSEIKHTTVLPI